MSNGEEDNLSKTGEKGVCVCVLQGGKDKVAQTLRHREEEPEIAAET